MFAASSKSVCLITSRDVTLFAVDAPKILWKITKAHEAFPLLTGVRTSATILPVGIVIAGNAVSVVTCSLAESLSVQEL